MAPTPNESFGACCFLTAALERMKSNISVSVEERQLRAGGTGLSWNLTAPCRLEAEVWLCKREQPGGRCEEVHGSRQRVHDGWNPTRKGHWVIKPPSVSVDVTHS